ncbi:MAG: NUDIX domain-containing protein [Ectothiorhodospiraceae bacterium]|nr:NUDIX domain-containing protein [Ectothiorhodospiraceae bacterium]MCH8503282.1 NUDIX domain-containing protein [Ectothiorhodospiraceae bacterium]
MRCACLVEFKDDHLLLVRVRENQHWYLPGGKIEPDETAEQALTRELQEELRITLASESIRYLYTVKGPAYGTNGDVELICFSADWEGDIRPAAEITDARPIHIHDSDKLAPAVRLLCEKHLAARSE